MYQFPKNGSPLLRGLVGGTIMAAMVFVVGLIDERALEPLTIKRAIFAFASVLLMIGVVDGASLRPGRRSFLDKDRLVYAYVTGAAWGIPMIMALWVPSEQGGWGLFVFSVAAAFFGVSMAFMLREAEDIEPIAQYYHLDQPVTDQAFGRFIYYAWPLVTICLLAGLAMIPPPDGWTASYLDFQIVLLPALARLFHQKQQWYKTPYILGLLVFMGGYLAF